MMQEERRIQSEAAPIHNVIMESRKKLSVSGVEDMECFDDGKVVVYTTMGILEIKGMDFHMNKLNLDTGEIIIEGSVDSICYLDQKPPQKAKESFLAKMFK